jgi:tetratricopeptide (TPR) repeat protein
MNLEQIVKETVAKIVAEKQGKDLTGDGKIDSADYLKARSNAIEKAKGLDEDYEDHEVSMAQSSLNSILRSAMELKAKIGGNEIDIPAWIQDHITNSENFIDQASQGYHEYSNGGEHGEMDEAIVSSDNVVDHLANALEYIWAAGKGNNSINFQDMAQSLYSDMFGGDEMNEGGSDGDYEHDQEVEAKSEELYDKGLKLFRQGKTKEAESLRQQALKSGAWLGWGETEFPKYDLDEVFQPKSSFDDYKIGDNVTVAGKKAKITNMKMDDESGERRARVRFEDGTAEEISINTIDENIMTTNEGRSAEDLKQGQLDQAYSHLEKIKEKPKLFSSEDIKKAEARIEKLEAELDALAAKATNESLDEATVRRWQHYAGIK